MKTRREKYYQNIHVSWCLPWKQVIVPQLQHSCSQQQLSDICNLVQSCEQVEYALARGMEKLHQILHNATTEGERGLKLTSAPQQMRFLKQVTNACMHSF